MFIKNIASVENDEPTLVEPYDPADDADDCIGLTARANTLFRRGVAAFCQSRFRQAYRILAQLSETELTTVTRFESSVSLRNLEAEFTYPALAEAARLAGKLSVAAALCASGLRYAEEQPDSLFSGRLIPRLLLTRGAVLTAQGDQVTARQFLDRGLREMLNWHYMDTYEKAGILRFWLHNTYLPAMRRALRTKDAQVSADELLLFFLTSKALQKRVPGWVSDTVFSFADGAAPATRELWAEYRFLFKDQFMRSPFCIEHFSGGIRVTFPK